MSFYSRSKNPKGVEIVYNERYHTYTTYIGEERLRYLSGTAFISRFFPEFDPDGEIAKRCAEREGITTAAVKRMWAEKRDRSRARGNMVHEVIESALNGENFQPSVDKELIDEEEGRRLTDVSRKVADVLLKRLDIIGVEQLIFDADVALTGTMDLFGRSKRDGKLWIIDYKSTERIDMENKYNSFGFYPINHLANINYIQYSLQLNLYENLLKRGGYISQDETVNKALIHIREDGRSIYQIEDMQQEINAMIGVASNGGPY